MSFVAPARARLSAGFLLSHAWAIKHSSKPAGAASLSMLTHRETHSPECAPLHRGHKSSRRPGVEASSLDRLKAPRSRSAVSRNNALGACRYSTYKI